MVSSVYDHGWYACISPPEDSQLWESIWHTTGRCRNNSIVIVIECAFKQLPKKIKLSIEIVYAV